MQIVKVVDGADVTLLHRQVIAPHFPVSERGPAAALVAGVLSGRQEVFGVQVRGVWAACAVIERFTTPGIVLLDWLAVVPELRSGGWGRALVRHVVREAAASGAGLVIAEIEDPGGPAQSEAWGDPARRARFYAGLGAKAILVPHDQPPLAEGQPSVPLLLIALTSTPLGDRLPNEPLRSVLSEYLGDHPSRAVMERALEGDRVPLVPISPDAFMATRR